MTIGEVQYVKETVEFTKKPLHDDPPTMVTQMREAQGRVGYMYFILAAANAELDRAENSAAELMTVGKEKLSAYVLEVKVRAAVSEMREFRDRVQGQIKSLEGMCMTGAVILRYLRGLPQE